MNEIISATITIILGILFTFFGGKGEKFTMHINGKPLVAKFADKEIGLFRLICVVLGLIALTIGALELLK